MDQPFRYAASVRNDNVASSQSYRSNDIAPAALDGFVVVTTLGQTLLCLLRAQGRSGTPFLDEGDVGGSSRVILDPDNIVLAGSTTVEIDDTDSTLVSTTSVTGDDLACETASATFTTEGYGEFLDGAALVEVGVVRVDDMPEGLRGLVFSKEAAANKRAYGNEGEAWTGVPLQYCALVLFRGGGAAEHHLLFFVGLLRVGRVEAGRCNGAGDPCSRHSALRKSTCGREGGAVQGGHGGWEEGK